MIHITISSNKYYISTRILLLKVYRKFLIHEMHQQIKWKARYVSVNTSNNFKLPRKFYYSRTETLSTTASESMIQNMRSLLKVKVYTKEKNNTFKYLTE